MGLFSILSHFLTGTGYLLLTYRSSFVLSQNPDERMSLLESLGMKWVVFILFLILEPTLETILDIIPFGCLALLAVKCMIVLPENTLATYIYKRIEKQLERMQFEQYNTKLSIYTSMVCKFITIKLIRAAKAIAIYVKAGELEQIYLGLQDTLAVLEYKIMAVGVKSELGKSKLQRQMSNSFNNDDSSANIDQNDLEGTDPEMKPSDIKESQIFNRMSMINLGSPKNAKNQDKPRQYRVQADIMTVKPNKQKGIKPKYESGTIVFNPSNKDISFTYKDSGRSHTGVLNEIKYVKMNMMVIELILENDPSVVIKFLHEQDVFPWVRPVMNCLSIS